MLSDRNFCVTIASALALIAFVVLMRFMPDFLAWKNWQACGPGNCNIQSWLSALSGWVAAFAAFLTIRYLSRQITEANRNHYDMVSLQVHKDANLARIIISQSKTARAYAKNVVAGQNPHMMRSVGLHFLQNLKKIIDGKEFDEFEDRIGSNLFAGLEATRVFIDQSIIFVRETFTETNILQMEPELKAAHFMQLDMQLHNLEVYTAACINSAEEFLRRWNKGATTN
ncbi:hypothetical protein ACIQUG_08375 [Ensifer sp. NPDC090286]|uniref:hypothetical protein n=1 Tax=Ensifer sp. NPDC090286 TaxID=3363991 RepID=UPI00383B2B90